MVGRFAVSLPKKCLDILINRVAFFPTVGSVSDHSQRGQCVNDVSDSIANDMSTSTFLGHPSDTKSNFWTFVFGTQELQ